ncbi:MAG TPA: RDD family protein [Nocardioidaceae bacterium]
MTQTPAGWYPDPAPQAGPQQPGAPRLRYWDGRAWTEHVHPSQQYGAPPAVTGPTTPDGAPLSGWWRRVGAFVIDSLLIGVATSIVTIPQQVQMQSELDRLVRQLEADAAAGVDPDLGRFFGDYLEVLQPTMAWSAVIGFLAWTLYTSLMLRFKGATLGKMALGIAVRLREQPGQLPWSTVLVRALVQFGVSLAAVVPVLYFALSWFPLLDSLWPLWDKKRQALHDKAAATNVVRVR